MPPLRQDSDAASSVLERTRATYQRQGLAFALWLKQWGLRPESADEWDDLLVEWKNAAAVSKNSFSGAVAAVEFYFPMYRGHLPWSHHVLKGMNIVHVPKHTVPMMYKYACFFAVHFVAKRAARLGVGIVTQQLKGLRPSEMLGLRARDVSLPEEGAITNANSTVLNLGAKTGTKAKRPQAAIVPGDHIVTELLRRTKAVCVSLDERLFPYTLAKYNTLLRQVCSEHGLEDTHWSAHSPRAGFASEARAQGKSFVEIREEGRWVADSSLRIYIDVVATSQLETDLKSSHVKQAADFAAKHIDKYLSRAVLAASA